MAHRICYVQATTLIGDAQHSRLVRTLGSVPATREVIAVAACGVRRSDSAATARLGPRALRS
jgi:hypothetical protein